MLPTMDAKDIPARLIVSKESIFSDKHRPLFDCDFDWKKESDIYEEIKLHLEQLQLSGILVKTNGGCHFICSKVMTFSDAERLYKSACSYAYYDEKYLEMSRKRGYFSLRVSQKYDVPDLEVDTSYRFHDKKLAEKYMKLLNTYRDYFKFRKPLLAYQNMKVEKDLLDKYQEKVIGLPQPAYENSYSKETVPEKMYSSSY
jgi:hypothetical protein